MNNETLVSKVTIFTPDAVVLGNDVKVIVASNGRGGTTVQVNATAIDYTVSLGLTEGERIALIEALGGKAS